MSGRSGYGRSKIVGKLIHLPANPMMAGLAPRIGKPGWAIRLYYARVDECFCCTPIRIKRRIFVPGLRLNPAANDRFVVKHDNELTEDATKTQAYYGIVFDREITLTSPSFGTVATSDTIHLTTTPVHSDGQINYTAAPAGFTTPVKLISTDFRKISNSATIGKPGQPFVIDIGGGLMNPTAPWVGVNNAGDVNSTDASLGSVTGDTPAYLVTNTEKFGGHTLLFNVTNLIVSSYTGQDVTIDQTITPVSIPWAGTGDTTNFDNFRKEFSSRIYLANNISTIFIPGVWIIVTTEICIPGKAGLQVAAPIGGFAVASPNGQPPLELLG